MSRNTNLELQLEAVASDVYLSIITMEVSNNTEGVGKGQMAEDRMLEFIQQIFIERMTCIRNSSQCWRYSSEQSRPNLFFFFVVVLFCFVLL